MKVRVQKPVSAARRVFQAEVRVSRKDFGFGRITLKSIVIAHPNPRRAGFGEGVISEQMVDMGAAS
jgi:hypothetical protein